MNKIVDRTTVPIISQLGRREVETELHCTLYTLVTQGTCAAELKQSVADKFAAKSPESKEEDKVASDRLKNLYLKRPARSTSPLLPPRRRRRLVHGDQVPYPRGNTGNHVPLSVSPVGE